MELAGRWRAVEADEALRRAYPGPDFPDDDWAEIEVPGHWRSTPAFAAADGPLLFRRRFDAVGPARGRRAWLTFDGLFHQGDVWLDGSYVGDTEGYFFPHTFEVTDALRDRAEHLLALELHAEAVAPGGNPGGIWRPVRLHETGPVRIARVRALCSEATPDRAVVRFRAVLDAAQACTVRLRTTVGGTDHEQDQTLAAGENRVLWQLVVEQPDLWWPHALGEQPLHDVAVEVTTPEGRSDDRRFRIGLRQVRLRSWICSVNGERLFLKGANHDPPATGLGDVGADELDRHVVAAKEAGLDLLRVHGHVSAPDLYEAADRHGLLLWQDFPWHWTETRGRRKQAARQAREAVDLLGHHPSIALWCGQRAFEKADGTRPTVHRPRAVRLTWSDNDRWDAETLFGVWPRMARFVDGLDGRHHVEHLRRLKYRPTGGFTYRSAAETDGVAAACAPVIVAADRPAASYAPGDAVALDIHVVSDLRIPVARAVVHAELRWDGGGVSWSWTGDVPADSCVRVGMVRAVVPDAPGPMVLELSLEAADVKAANRYRTTISST